MSTELTDDERAQWVTAYLSAIPSTRDPVATADGIVMGLRNFGERSDVPPMPRYMRGCFEFCEVGDPVEVRWNEAGEWQRHTVREIVAKNGRRSFVDVRDGYGVSYPSNIRWPAGPV